MNQAIVPIEETNISEAWRKSLEYVLHSPAMEITPLVVSLTGFEENLFTRTTLDEHLVRNKYGSIQTVSETIFPQSLYGLFGENRNDFYECYINNLPRLKGIEPRGNGRGTYFERLIAYNGSNDTIQNQLEIIILSLMDDSKVVRRSKLQASIFDPIKDHTDTPYQGFPCLQHVTFYKTKNGGLVLNSFYAIQYLYRRAYGNWLGLINLGKFVAKETGLEFEKFNCFVGVEKLDKLKRIEAKELLNTISQ